MGQVGIFLVLVKHQLSHVEEGKSEAGVHAAGLLKPPLDEFRIDHLSHQGRRQDTDPRGDNLGLHIPADLFGGGGIDVRFEDQGVNDPPPVPADDFLIRGPDKQGDVRGFFHGSREVTEKEVPVAAFSTQQGHIFKGNRSIFQKNCGCIIQARPASFNGDARGPEPGNFQMFVLDISPKPLRVFSAAAAICSSWSWLRAKTRK